MMIEEQTGAEDVGRGVELALMTREWRKKEIELAVENVKRKNETVRFGLDADAGRKGAGNRSVLKIAVLGMIWDNDCLEGTVVLSMLRWLRRLETVEKVWHLAVAGDGAE